MHRNSLAEQLASMDTTGGNGHTRTNKRTRTHRNSLAEQLASIDTTTNARIHDLLQKQDEQFNEALGAQVREVRHRIC